MKPFWEHRLEEIKTASFNQSNNRIEKHTQQYIENGFDDSDTWGLDYHLAKLILPRLERFKELATGVIVIDFPLEDMIHAFDLYVNKDDIKWTEEDWESWDKGIKAFAEYYRALWW
jgi:hypothetical protein